MSVFKRIFSGKSKNVPEYEGPIVLLDNIRALAIGLINDCTAITKTFNQEEGPLQNISECLAINLKMFGNALKCTDADYSNFLLKLYTTYDEIGRAQRKFHADLKEQVIDPLNAWLLTDYTRMNGEILKLHDRKKEVDKANDGIKTKKEDQIVAEQTVKEFERQLEIVKMELLKLTMVKNEHAGLFYNFLDLYKDYHKTVEEVLVESGAEKASSTSGLK